MYVWPETGGSHGSHEILSCLIKHLKIMCQKLKEKITSSDSCAGQNRNIKIPKSILKLFQSNESSDK